MKIRKLVCMLLCLMMALSALPALAAPTGGFVERAFALPDGYARVTPFVKAPGGGFAAAAQRADDGQWELLRYAASDAEPTAMPLTLSSGSISGIQIAPDGQILVQLENEAMSGPMLRSAEEDGAQQPEGMVRRGDGEAQIIDGAPPEGANVRQEGPGGQAVQGAPGSAQIGRDGSASSAQGGERRLFQMGDMSSAFAWLGEDGVEVSRFDVRGMMISARALPGRLTAALGVNEGVVAYDEKGMQVWNVPSTAILAIDAYSDRLAVVEEGKFTILSALTGKEIETREIGEATGTLALAEDGTAYLVSEMGVFKSAPGAAFERISDAGSFAFGDPSQTLSGLAATADGLVAIMGGEGGFSASVSSGGRTSITLNPTAMDVDRCEFYAYDYDASLDLSQRQPFRISALRGSAKLRKAVSEFQRAHPELHVTLEAMLQDDDYVTPVEDAIRALNTSLLAGKGGDVIILDGLPLTQYIDKGVLRPLDGVLEGIDFLPGIVEGSRADDGLIYAMPAQFTLNTVWGEADVLGAFTSLQSLLALPAQSSQGLLYARSAKSWMEDMYALSAQAFTDESGKPAFDTPEFAAFLEALYALYSAQVEDVADREASNGMAMPDIKAMIEMRNGALKLFDLELGGTMTAPMGYSATGESATASVALMPSWDGAGYSYKPSLLAGISALTDKEALATEFLQALYSATLQDIEQTDGFPTNVSSLNKLFDEAKERNNDGPNKVMMMVSDGTSTLEINQPTDEIWDALRALCDRVDTAYIRDETLLSFMADETASFFEGRITAEEAARSLSQRAAAYINE